MHATTGCENVSDVVVNCAVDTGFVAIGPNRFGAMRTPDANDLNVTYCLQS